MGTCNRTEWEGGNHNHEYGQKPFQFNPTHCRDCHLCRGKTPCAALHLEGIHLRSESNSTRAASQYKQRQSKMKEDRKHNYIAVNPRCESCKQLWGYPQRRWGDDVNNYKRYRVGTESEAQAFAVWGQIEERTLHFINKTEWLWKACNITNGQQKSVRNRELNTSVGRNSVTQDWKFKILGDINEIIKLWIYRAGIDNTSQKEVQQWSSLSWGATESRSTRVWLRGLSHNQRAQTHWVGISSSLNYQLLNC